MKALTLKKMQIVHLRNRFILRSKYLVILNAEIRLLCKDIIDFLSSRVNMSYYSFVVIFDVTSFQRESFKLPYLTFGCNELYIIYYFSLLLRKCLLYDV